MSVALRGVSLGVPNRIHSFVAPQAMLHAWAVVSVKPLKPKPKVQQALEFSELSLHPAPMKLPPNMIAMGAVAFILLQIALPLSYYVNENEYDERFAWRMFSSVRMTRCSFQLASSDGTTETPLSLPKEYHVVWINLAKRARLDVIDAMVERACAKHSVIVGALQCSTPQSPAIGLCRNARDLDGDGIPDGYQSLVGCDALSASGCFQRDCPTGITNQCVDNLCKTDLIPRGVNLCDTSVVP